MLTVESDDATVVAITTIIPTAAELVIETDEATVIPVLSPSELGLRVTAEQ